TLYQGNLYYARDAFAGLHTMDKLMSSNGDAAVLTAAGDGESVPGAVATGSPDDEELLAEEAKLGVRKPTRVRPVAGDTTHTTRSSVSSDAPIPQPPFFRSRVVDRIPLNNVFQFVNETALFKGQWQFKQGRKSNEEYQTFVSEHVRPVYEELK